MRIKLYINPFTLNVPLSLFSLSEFRVNLPGVETSSETVSWKQLDRFDLLLVLSFVRWDKGYISSRINFVSYWGKNLSILSNIPWIMRFSLLAIGTVTIRNPIWTVGTVQYFFSWLWLTSSQACVDHYATESCKWTLWRFLEFCLFASLSSTVLCLENSYKFLEITGFLKLSALSL